MKARRFHVLAAYSTRAPIPVAVLAPETMAILGLESGMRAIAVNGPIRVGVWICSTNEAPQKRADAEASRGDVVWLSKRARNLLHLEEGMVELLVEEFETFAVFPALVDQLPRDDEADVAAADARRLGPWLLVHNGGVTIPIRVRPRRNETGTLRMSRLTRVLAGLREERPSVRLSRFQDEKLLWSDALSGITRIPGWSGTVAALLLRPLRKIAWVTELLLRALFHAPALAMATVEARLGDDTNRIIRIPSETFSLLGIAPGDDVLIEWAGRRVMAVAHESGESIAGDHASVPTVDTWGSDKVVPSEARHLIIGIGAEMRGELRIPRRTVVTVRRRVTSIFVDRINELTVPVGGLLLAAVAIQNFPIVYVIAGTVVVTILAMLPARYRVPPRGRWP
jgi:hypothetical protein